MATITKDVAVYGDHPAAINAAIEVARAGKSVVLFTPEYRLGAPYSAGLGAMDVGTRGSKAFGSWTIREYMRAIALNEAGGRIQYRNPSPAIAEMRYRDMLKYYGVPVLTGENWAIKETGGVTLSGTDITAVTCDNNHVIAATNYIDGSEDGDLAGFAGCTMTVGLESAATFGESLAGFQPSETITLDVTDSSTGTGYVWGVQADPGLVAGDACAISNQNIGWRLTVTDDKLNQRRWPKPDNYDEALFEFDRRTSNVGVTGPGTYTPLGPKLNVLLHGKRDINDDTGWLSAEWPTATRARRAEIMAINYAAKAGWMWYLANSPLVHDNIRRELDTWQLCYDEHLDGSTHSPTATGWPHTFYRRGTRRLTNAGTVMTQADLQTNVTKTDAIATGHYNIDCHSRMKYAVNGGAGYRTDTLTNKVGFTTDDRRIIPYQIPASCMYTSEVTNLLVPNCMGASFVAYCSMRIDLWKANMGSVAGLWAARSVIESTPIQSYSITTAGTGLQARIVALGGVITPS